MINTSQDLKDLLFRINRKSYPAYKDTKGSYRFPGYVLSIDHVQGDPFAAPSKLSLHIKGAQAGFPEALYATREMRIALQDQLIRGFAAHIEKYSFRAKGSGKSGLISISRPGQEILERSACTMDAKNGDLTLRLEVGFPANGRTVNSGELIKILFNFLPVCVKASLFYRNLDARKLEQVRALAEDQTFIRKELAARNLTAFVANGAVLPRESGVSPLPMKDGISFVSPDSMAVTLHLPNHGPLTGMGIPCGITLIVGGGYHGKSTLLEALELGVYNHIAGDGREYVITRDDAVKIRAEDGRSIKHTDISFFINDLPNHKDTHSFYSEDASGSTSQAANVIEALETGSHLLLIDEDTSATNFMIRDELMQRVVNRNQEPITPFIERQTGMTLDEAESRLVLARRLPFPKDHVQLLSGLCGAFCFAMMFGGNLRSALAAAGAGLVASWYLLWCGRHEVPGGFQKISTAALITLVCILLCNLLHTSASHAIIGTLMILTPGIAFTMGIRDFVQGDYLSGTIRMIDALLIAASIAIGTGLVLRLYTVLTGVVVV